MRRSAVRPAEPPRAEDREDERRGNEQDGGAPAPGEAEGDEVRARIYRHGCSLELGPQLWRRPGCEQHLVDANESRALLRLEVVTNERVEIDRLTHPRSSSSTSASRARALLVLVFTVPSGRCKNSAISLCDSPLQ